MKRKIILLLSVMLILLILSSLLLYKPSYSKEKAIKNGDVIVTHHASYNIDNFYKFIKQNREKIRIIIYTDEGDPVIIELKYTSNEEIIYKLDQSKDKFSAKKTVIQGVCKHITEKKYEEGSMFKLEGCSNSESIHLLSITEKS